MDVPSYVVRNHIPCQTLQTGLGVFDQIFAACWTTTRVAFRTRVPVEKKTRVGTKTGPRRAIRPTIYRHRP